MLKWFGYLLTKPQVTSTDRLRGSVSSAQQPEAASGFG